MVVAILGQDSPFFLVVFSFVSHPWLGPHPVSFQEALSGVFEHNDRSYRFQIPDAMYLYKPLLFLVRHNATHLLILRFRCHCHQSSFSNFYATMNLSYPILRMARTHLETKLHRRADLVPYYRSGLKLFLCSWGLNQHDALKSITRRDVGSKVN